MKTIKLLSFLLLFGLLQSSCSDADNPDESLIGSWAGTIVQPQFGELITTLKINNTTLNGQTGNGSFVSGDIAVCDETIFNCIPLACTFNLSLLSKTGTNFYEVDQMLIETNTTCGDGIFEITYKDKNTLQLL